MKIEIEIPDDELKEMLTKVISERLHEMNKTGYVLEKDGEVLIFESEKAACEYLGVVKCSISSCYRREVKCKGYKIAKMDKEGV